MISGISIKNYRSFYKEQKIDFSKSKIGYLNSYVTKEKILNPIFFYGKNSSGKSNVLEVFRSIYMLMNNDLSNEIKSEPIFMFNKYFSDEDELVEIKINLELDFGSYEYFVCGSNYHYIKEERLIDVKTGKNIIEGFVPKDAYKKSILRDSNIQDKFIEVKKIYSFLKNIYIDSVSGKKFGNINMPMIDIIRENSQRVKEIVEQLDGGVVVDFIKKNTDTGDAVLYYKEINGVEIPVDPFMSSGTFKMYELISMLFYIPSRSVVVIDEIEIKLHPTLLVNLIEIVNKYFNVQLIISTHSTTLMRSLRPDQIYIVKRKEFNSNVERLTDIKTKIREKQNVEKLYFEEFKDILI